MSLPELAAIVGLLAAAIALAELARKTRVPYPTMMVIAGLAITVMPFLPDLSLSPDLVFLVFLPPILYAGAWNTWLHDFRRHAVPIGFLAVGLVIVTAWVVAEVCTLVVPGMSWWQGFLLGAIVSPPDAAAATAICQRLGVSRRIVTVLEGESLVNDASGLIAYRVALVAVTQGAFSPLQTAWSFVFAAGAGVGIGLVAGLLLVELHRRIRDPIATTALSLIAPYASYVPAEALHASGVLATVVAGLYVSKQSPRIFSPLARMQVVHVWQLMLLLINGVVFVLIGLQLDEVIDAVKNDYSLGQLAGYAAAVSGAVILVRLAWVLPIAGLSRLPFFPRRLPVPRGAELVVIGWTGMRGIVSLAAAVALPMTVTLEGNVVVPFEHRDLIVLLTFAVIFSTLVLQSLTLGPLIHRLGDSVREGIAHEELVARMMIASAALSRLDAFGTEGADDPTLTRVRAKYLERLEAATRTARGDDAPNTGVDPGLEATLHRMAIDEERAALVRMRDAGEISEEVFRTLERELDFEEARLQAS